MKAIRDKKTIRKNIHFAMQSSDGATEVVGEQLKEGPC
jgi:hypothetical protein